MLLSIRPFRTNLYEILIKIQNFSFTEMHLNISSVKWWPFCPGGYELTVMRVSSQDTAHAEIFATKPQHWFRLWLGTKQQAITLTNDDKDMWCHITSQGLKLLMKPSWMILDWCWIRKDICLWFKKFNTKVWTIILINIWFNKTRTYHTCDD